jgi:glucose dehydrogenase/mono/diheme cytochrome c family protein
MLATLRIDGRERKVLMQAPKNGFFYVIDRSDGKLISARNFVPVNWASGIDLQTGRPIEARNVRYDEGSFTMWPGPVGGHAWQPMAYSPLTGLVYIPAGHNSFTYADEPGYSFHPGRWNMGTAMIGPPEHPTAINGLPPPGARPNDTGELIAWDPVAQKPRWSVAYPASPNGGVLATAGNLVFQGNIGGQFQAFRANDGTPLWSAQAGTGVVAAPISYQIDGVQYVAVAAGSGGSGPMAFRTGKETRTVQSGRILVYKLGGKASMLPDDSSPLAPPQPSDEVFTTAQVELGRATFMHNCIFCHGGYVLPDLRRSAALRDGGLWHKIVIGGALEPMGMASFRTILTPEQAEAVRAYANSEAKAMIARADKAR